MTHITELNNLNTTYSSSSNPEVAEDALRELKSLLQLYLPSIETQEETHWSENPSLLKALSLLRQIEASDSSSPVDPLVFKTFFENFSPPDTAPLLSYIKAFCESQGLSFLPLDRLYQEAEADLEAIKHIISHGKVSENREEALLHLREFSQTLSSQIHDLPVGQKRLTLGTILGTPPKLHCMSHNISFISSFLNEDPKKLAQQLISSLKSVSAEAFQDDPLSNVKSILTHGIINACIPQLTQSVIENKPLLAQIALAPLELLRLGVHKGVSALSETLTEGLKSQLEDLLGAQEVAEIYQALVEDRLEPVLQSKVENWVSLISSGFQNYLIPHIHALVDELPSYMHELLELFGIGSLGSKEQQLCLEIQKEPSGNFTVLLFLPTSACYTHPTIEVHGQTARQIVMQYQDVHREALDTDFFFSLFSYQVLPQWDPSCRFSMSDFQDNLIASLGQAPSDLSDQPSAYHLEPHLLKGKWGLIQSQLHYYLKFTSPKHEEQFFFDLRMQLLLEGWVRLQNDPSFAPSLRAAALSLLPVLERQHHQQQKELYATLWEILLATSDSKLQGVKKQTVVPQEVAAHFQNLFSTQPIDTVKDLLIGAAGPEMKHLIEDLAEEFPPPLSRNSPLLVDQCWNVINACCDICLGVSLDDVLNPSYWSYIRIALLTARIAITLLFPAFGMAFNQVYIVSKIAQIGLKEVASFFFPEQVRLFESWKNQWIGYLFASLVFSDAQRAHFDAILSHYHKLLTRKGNFSFDLTPEASSHLKSRSYQFHATPIPTPQESVARTSSCFLFPKKETLDPLHVEEILASWLERIQKMPSSDDINRFLNEQIRLLPVPLPGDGDDLWSQAPNSATLLEHLGNLSLKLSSSLGYSSQERSTWVKINLHKLYAIIDKLARKNPENRLEGFKPNGWNLAGWSKEILFRLYDVEMRRQLNALYAYFEINPEEDGQIESDHPKADEIASSCLFFSGSSFKKGSVLPSFALERYLAQFLEDPLINTKLEAIGVLPSFPYVEKISALYADESFVASKHGKNFSPEQIQSAQALLLDGGKNPRNSVMPRGYYLMLLSYLGANQTLFIHNVDNTKQPLIKIYKKGNIVGDIFEITGTAKTQNGGGLSFLNRIPKLYYLYTNKESNLWIPLSKRSSFDWYYVDSNYPIRVGNLGKITANFFHMPPRKQNEILNHLPRFDQLREKETLLASSFNWLFGGGGNKPIETLLSKLPAKERAIFEMLRCSSDDQAVRTVAYFEMHLERLKEVPFNFLLNVLLLQGDVLYPYLQKHPEFGFKIGEFFKRALSLYQEQQDWDTILLLAETAIFARAVVEASCPTLVLEGHFPDIDALLDRLVTIPLYKHRAVSLKALPWFFVDPDEASFEQVKKALRAISLKMLHADHAKLRNPYPDLIWKWTPKLIEALDHTPEMRSYLLNEMAAHLGYIDSSHTSLQWEGSFPTYSCGNIKLRLDAFDPKNTNEHLNIAIEEGLVSLFGSNCPSYEKETNGICWIPSHQIGAELKSSLDGTLPFLVFFKLYKGEKYYWVSSSVVKSNTSQWMGPVKENGWAPLLEFQRETGIWSPAGLARSHHDLPNLTDGEVFQTVENEDDLQEIDLQKGGHRLQILSWFQPLSKMRAWKKKEDSLHLHRIEFSDLNLSFKILEGKAVGEEAISDLVIAPIQQQEDRYPILNRYGRYLLLEDSGGNPKVILPTTTLTTAAVSWLIKQATSISTSHLADSLIEQLLSKWQSSSKTKYYLYSLDPSGRLASSDPTALLHLLCYDLFHNQFQDVHHHLFYLEDLSRRIPFSEEAQTLCSFLSLVALGMNPIDIVSIGLKLSAIAEENRLVQTGHEKKPTQIFVDWVTLQLNYLKYLKEAHRSRFPLNEYQELFILQSLASSAKQLLKNVWISSLRKLISNIGLDMVAESLLLRPDVAKRYQFLKQKYATEREVETIGIKTLVRSWVVGDSTSSDSTQTSLSSEMILALTKRLPHLDPLSFTPLQQIDLNAPLEDLPLSASTVTAADFAKNLHLYYLVAMGDASAIAKTYHPKLQRMLLLIKGRSFHPELDPWIEILRAACLSPSFFPPQQQLVDFISALQKATDPEKITQNNHLLSHLQSAYSNASFLKLPSTGVVKKVASKVGTTIAFSYFSSYVSAAFPLLPLGVAAFHGYNAYRQLNQTFSRAQSERALLSTPSSAMTPRLPPHLMEHDLSLGEILIKLLHQHCHQLDSTAADLFHVEPFEAQTADAVIQKYFQRLNQSLSDYYERPQNDTPLFQPLDTAHFEHLGQDLEAAKTSLQELLKTLTDDLLSYTRRKDPSDSDYHILEKEPVITDALFFQSLVQAFGKEDENWLYQNTTLTEKRLPIFEEKIYSLLIHATRLHQVERALKILNKIPADDFESLSSQILLKQFSFELTRRRAYSFEHSHAKLARGLLLFEYGTQTMLWEKQVRQLQEILLGDDRRVVLELIMGSGKTFFGIPMTSFIEAQRKQPIFNCFPDSLAPTAIEQISQTSRHVFGQASNSVEISRSKRLEADHLWGILKTFNRALHYGEHFSGRKKDLQALELRFIEELYNEGDYQTLTNYKHLLGLIRTQYRGNIDEFHRLLRRNEELNHPLGVQKQVEANYIATIIECLLPLVSSLQISTLVRIKDSRPPVIQPDVYHATLKPLLADHLSRSNTFAILEEDRPLFAAYLCGSTNTVPPFIQNHPKKQEIGLAVGVLNDILPDALKLTIRVHYGPSKAGNGEYARPYSGNEEPVESATIKNPYEAVVKTCLLFLHQRLTLEQTHRLVEKLQELAQTERGLRGIPKENTRIARHFAAWTQGVTLSSLEKAPLDATTLATLSNHDLAILAYAKYCVIPEITYYTKNLKSDSFNFASMFSSFYGATASPNRDGAFPLTTKVAWDRGTAGDFVDFVCKTCTLPDSILTIQSNAPKTALAEILTLFFPLNSKASALIDTGALFNGITSSSVAKQIIDFILESRPDLDGVIFFNEAQKLMCWRKESTTPTPFKPSALETQKWITYFDHSHTFGADIRQPLESLGIVTVSESTTIEELAQGGGRMRGLKTAQQRLAFVVSKAAKQLISGTATPSIKNIITFTQTNEASLQGYENYLAARQKITDVIRRSVLDEIIFAPDVARSLQYFKAFEFLFISDEDQNPFSLYGQPRFFTSPQIALDVFKQEQLDLLESTDLFSTKQITHIKNQIAPIGSEDRTYPETVPSTCYDLGASQEVAQNQDQEVQQEQQVQLQQDLQVETAPPIPPTVALRLNPALWDENTAYFETLTWLQIAPALSPSDHRHVAFYSVSGSHRLLAQGFKDTLWWSNNFLGIKNRPNTTVYPPLSHGQKPIFELLVTSATLPDGTTTFTSGAIDQEEAAAWRQRFAQNRLQKRMDPNLKIGLFDLTLLSVVDTGHNRLRDDELFLNDRFCLDIVRWKFLAGHTEIARKINPAYDKKLIQLGSLWIQEEGIDKMRQLFVEIHKRHGHQKYAGSDMELLLSNEDPVI